MKRIDIFIALIAATILCMIFIRRKTNDKTRIYSTRDGIVCAIIPVDGPRFFLSMTVSCGFDHENDASLHASHFLEHMMASLTSKTCQDSKHITHELEKLGAVVNAYTRYKETTYWIDGPCMHFPIIMELFVSAMQDFAPDMSIFEQERDAVIQELNSKWLEDPWLHFEKMIDGSLYKGHIRSVPPERHLDNVRKLSIDDLMTFKSQYYTPSNTAWVFAGPPVLSACLLSRLSDRTWRSTNPQDSTPSVRHDLTDGPRAIGELWSGNRASGRVTLIFRVQGTIFDIELSEALWICKQILTVGLSSRLMRRLRGEMGAVYSVKATVTCDANDPRLSSFRIDTTCDKSPSTVRRVSNEMLALAKHSPTEDERTRMRAIVQRRYDEQRYDRSPKRASKAAAHLVWKHKLWTDEERRDVRDALLGSGRLTDYWHRIFDNTPHVFHGN